MFVEKKIQFFSVYKMTNEELQKGDIPWRCAFPGNRKAVLLARCYRSILFRWLHPLAVLRVYVFFVEDHLQVIRSGMESLQRPPRELTPGLLKFCRGKNPSKNQCCGSRSGSASIWSAGSGSRSRRAKVAHKKRNVLETWMLSFEG
jgi:hypothetical protein